MRATIESNNALNHDESDPENIAVAKRGTLSDSDRYRLAAQQRRQMENTALEKLSDELPIAKAISKQHIDKTTVLRLASTYMRLNNCLSGISKPISSKTHAQRYAPYQPEKISVLEALDGFLICFAMSGEILYISETISIHLGLSQIDLTGKNIQSYIHPSDIQQWNQVLMIIYDERKPNMVNLRIKSTLTKRGTRDIAFCPIGFKVVSLNVNIFYGSNKSMGENYFAAHGQALPSTLPATIRLDSQSFIVITDVNLTVQSVDLRCKEILTINPLSSTSTTSSSSSSFQANTTTLKGTSFYKFIHVEDAYIIRTMHFELIKFGASTTPYYRLLSSDCTNTIYAQTTAAYTPMTNGPTMNTLILITRILS